MKKMGQTNIMAPHVGRAQLIGLVLGVVGYTMGWMALVCVKSKGKIEITKKQLMGLMFVLIIAVLAWVSQLLTHGASSTTQPTAADANATETTPCTPSEKNAISHDKIPGIVMVLVGHLLLV